ncbi:nucleoside phosphorylase [Haloprofundus salinisoli]|uniref:nucleoside phosphorylase n=1 Tax=Haloprofundus salinisoli TaxID=2876193 RepID=UPI001CCBCA69|nr:nucleoside phosphorylase [Haloprofundus salinisoli]
MIPHYGDKYDAEALFSPKEAVTAQDNGLPDVPSAIILGYQTELTEIVRERTDSKVDIVRSQYLYRLSDAVGYVPVHEWGIGAPITATVTENVVAAGASTVVMLGGCAGLQMDIAPDTAILPTESIRDEGVSYHYLPADEAVTATATLVDELDESFEDAGFETARGTTWTTSAMYRETIPEVERYRDDGVVSLCMESAAMWAVCRYRGVDTATVHAIGDYLTPDEWVPETEPKRGLVEMFDPTVRALESYVADQ